MIWKVCVIIFTFFIIAVTINLFIVREVSVCTNNILFRIDDSFSKQEIENIKDAIEEWQLYLGDDVFLGGYVEHINFIELFLWKQDKVPTIYDGANSWGRLVTHLITHNTNILGFATRFSKDIFITELGKSRIKKVILHEIAHVLGVRGHSKNKNDLMYPEVSKNSFITENDIKLVKKYLRIKR